jgi:hypothetical protein
MGGLGGGKWAVEFSVKGDKLARDVLRPGGRRGPVGVEGLPSAGRRVNCGRRGRGSERGEERGPEHEGARVDSRSSAQARATKGGLMLSATVGGDWRKEARSEGGIEGAQKEATE